MATWSPSNTKTPSILRALKIALRPQRQIVFSSSRLWATSSRRRLPGKATVWKSVRMP